MIARFDFKDNLEKLVRQLNSVTTNIDGYISSNLENSRNVRENRTRKTSQNIISCQVVIFNSDSKKSNEYQVYNYCDSVSYYEEKLNEYFSKKDANGEYINKSVLSIVHDNNDDGIWYSERDLTYDNITVNLVYSKPAPTTAVCETYTKEAECEKPWNNWSDLMYEIYPDKAVSVFAKKIKMSLSNTKTLYSGIYLTVACRLTYTQIGIIGRICETVLNEIAFIDLVPSLYEDIENQATRSAISQVMARNTSHNIGAHVMNKLIGDLRELSLLNFKNHEDNYQSNIKLKEVIHKQTVNKLENSKWYKKSSDENLKGEALKNEVLLDQISNFNSYVKCRMDYLADISFGTPLMQVNKFAYGELFKDLDKVRLLLEHISGLSDKFKFEIQFLYNGTQMDDKNDLLVAIPNDILGMQAFYNILENIIRNTAKYAKDEPEKTIFTVNFIDDINHVHIPDSTTKTHRAQEIQNILNDFIAVEVYDNIPVVGDGRALTKEEEGEYLRVHSTIPNKFVSEIDRLVFSQNSKINADILEDNKLRSSSLGVIEMDASAAYLRKRDVSFINHDNYSLLYDSSWSACSEACHNDPLSVNRGKDCRYFLKAFKKEGVQAEYSKGESVIIKTGSALGYRLFVLRPEVALVVTNIKVNDNDVENTYFIKELKNQGVWLVSPNDFEKHLVGGKVYNHEFVLYVKGEQSINDDGQSIEIAQLILNNKTALPARVLELDIENLRAEKEENIVENNTKGLFDKINNKSNENYKKEWLSVFQEFCWGKWEEKLKTKFKFFEYSKANYPKVDGRLARITNHLYPSDNQQSKHDFWKSLKEKSYYIEPASSKAQFYLPGLKDKELKAYPEILGKNLSCKIQVAEAILTRIIAIDERIQQANEKDLVGIPQQEVYKMMNIIVPEKSHINLSDLMLDEVQIRSYIEEMVLHSDFLLLHYSILERIFDNESDRLTKINNFLLNLSEITNVVVTSGRGIPNRLPPEVRFINLSSAIMAFNEVRGKYFINYLLHSSRKTNRI